MLPFQRQPSFTDQDPLAIGFATLDVTSTRLFGVSWIMKRGSPDGALRSISGGRAQIAVSVSWNVNYLELPQDQAVVSFKPT